MHRDTALLAVDWGSSSLRGARLDGAGRVLNTQHLLPREFLAHSLVEALAAGQLFTPPVRRPG